MLLEKYRSSRPEVFCKKDVLRNFAKFIAKHLYLSLFFSYRPRPATLLKKRLWQWCFPVNFVKFLRTLFYIQHLWWLLLKNIHHNLNWETRKITGCKSLRVHCWEINRVTIEKVKRKIDHRHQNVLIRISLRSKFLQAILIFWNKLSKKRILLVENRKKWLSLLNSSYSSWFKNRQLWFFGPNLSRKGISSLKQIKWTPPLHSA